MRDRSGVSFPLVIGVTLPPLLIFCGVSEHFRLQVIAVGVRDVVEDVIISTVSDNYAGVYHGIREGYSGGYMPYGGGEWEETLGEGDIYAGIGGAPRTGKSGGYHMKFTGNSGGVVESALTDLNITPRSTPLASSDPGNAQHFEVEAVTRLEVPVRFGRKLLLPMHITLRVQAGYTEVF